MAVVKQIVWAVGRIGFAAPVDQSEGGADIADDRSILRVTHGETFAKAGRLWVDQVIDMQSGLVRSDDRRQDVATADVRPALRVTIHLLMAPADHRVGTIKVAVG